MVLTLVPFLERLPSLVVHFVGIYSAPNGATSGGGIPEQGRNDLRPCSVCVALPRLESNYSRRLFRLHLFARYSGIWY